jgi:hypothetical protein
VEDAFRGAIIDNISDVAVMKRLWDTLRIESLTGKQSIDPLAEVVEEWK